MTYFKTPLILALAALTLTGCISMSAVPSGKVLNTEAAYSVTPTTDWTRFPRALNASRGSALTQDGLPLGAVYLVTADDDKAMLSKQSAANLPRFTAGSTALEQIDFLTASLAAMGYSDVAATNVQAADVDGQTGTQMNLTGKYPNGLNMRGDAVLVETEDGLNVVLYVAPQLHYYDKYKADADAILKSVDLK